MLDIFKIKCKTIVVSPNKIRNKFDQLLEYENTLRRLAYRNTNISLGPSFFDNSDMISEYYILIVYNKQSLTPLLSSRYYYHRDTIQTKLDGENALEMRTQSNVDKVELKNYSDGKIFLADRLSANSEHPIFLRNRNLIFLKYYLELFKNNIGNNYFLMVKSEKFEKFLTKYLRLGLLIVGKTKHRGLDHWILYGDFKASVNMFRRNNLLRLLLIFTSLFKCKKI